MAGRIATAAAIALLLASCGGSGEDENLAVVVAGPSAAAAALVARTASQSVGATLIAHDGLGQAVPGLASSWRFVDDGRTLILRLKPLKWTDGQPFTAADVVASFRRALSPAAPVAIKAGLASVENASAVATGTLPPARVGIFAPTSRVVEIRMTAATPLLLDWLAQPEFAVTRPGRAGRPPLSLGLYRSGAGTGAISLQRIGEASAAALPARIALGVLESPTAAATAVAAGKADLVLGTGIDGLEAVSPVAPPGTLRTEVVWGSYGYRANTRFGPLGDLRVRRALAMAVDRDALAKRFGGSGAAPLTGLVPPALAGGALIVPDWTTMNLAARQAAARDLLTSAGFGETRALRVTLLLPPGNGHRALATAVARDWAAIGVLMSVTELEPDALERAVAKGDYDLALAERATPVADRGFLLRGFACTRRGYCNAAADALIDRSRLLPPAAAAAALSEAEAAMLADTPTVPLLVPVRWALVRRGLAGWSSNPAGAHPLGRLVMITGSGLR